MADLQPVRKPRSVLEGHGALAATIVVVAIFVAMVKPWGGAGGSLLATLGPSAAPADPSAADALEQPAPAPSGFDLRYRPELFGGPEPLPGWGLWPAGYLVTFGFAAPVPPVGSPDPSPTAAPSRPTRSSPPSSSPAGSAQSSAPPFLSWPVRLDMPAGSHLLVLGINTPLGYDVSQIELQQYTAAGTLEPVRIEQLPSPWPDHFSVIGIRSRATDGHLVVWPPGRYRLAWTTDPGAFGQSIEIRILPVPVDITGP